MRSPDTRTECLGQQPDGVPGRSDREPARCSALASVALTAVIVSALFTGCVQPVAEQAALVLGSDLLVQQAPQFRRPTRDDTRLGRPPEGEVSGRHAFYWTRAIYSGRSRRGGWYGGGRDSWATDFPKGDRQFLVVLKRLVGLDAYDWENAVSLADPELRRFPLIYAVEVGRMDITDAEVAGLRRYLAAGGSLIVDDFWGTNQWANFVANIRRVLPDRPIVELPLDHPLFSAFYEIEQIKQVPNIGNARRGGPTHQGDGYVPHVRGIFDDDGRLMVVINWNTDLGDAWEWAEDPGYPLEYSTFAFEMGANMIVYAMSH